LVLSALFVLASFAAAAAPKSQPKSQKVQVECPGGLAAEGKEELLRKAPTCDAAMALFDACAYGGSGDAGLGAAVIENCEAGFAAKLSGAQRKAYDKEMKACVAKYRGKEGTMYISAAAFCRAGVAQRYARRFAKAGPAPK
jgi:hypothetical protein